MRRAGAIIAVLTLLTAVPGAGRAGSLPSVAIGPRPGPPLLYAPLASAPQLGDGGGWPATPLMVSGADAYAGGEYLFQDWIYDSYGANTTNTPFAGPDTVPNASDNAFGGMTGDVVYPTDAATYGHDAADLLEFRARLVPGGVAYRVTLNTMLAPDVAGIAVGIDADRDAGTGTNDWGYGIGSLGTLGLEHVAVSWGSAAEADGVPVTSTANLARNQIEFAVPWSPAGATWRHYLAVGLFDATAKSFKAILEQPTATQPGGAHGSTPPPIFNVGFRRASQEPMNDDNGTGSRSVGTGNWRDHAQALALAARDVAAFGADIDFAKLAAGKNESHVPASGYLNRLYVSHLNLGEGAQASRPMLLGKIQPYSVYVPTTYRPKTPAPLTLELHSLSATYNQYAVFAPNSIQELGQQRRSFILTTEGRGPDGWYHDEAEVDLFEAWADLASRYNLAENQVTVSGYSMGGYGTYKMASQYPDLFAKAFAVVGPADESILGGPTGGLIEDQQNTLRISDNLRNIPLLMWNGLIDELVPVAGVLRYQQRLQDLGYRHELDLFPTHDHFLFSILDQWGPAKTFLDRAKVDRDPRHVTYRAMPEMDNAALGLVHDHGYWVSDVRVAAGARGGLVDARSLRKNLTYEPASFAGPGTDPSPHVKRGVTWNPVAQVPENTLVVSLTDVASATLWIERSGLNTSGFIRLRLSSNIPATLTMAGTFGTRTISVPAGQTTQTFRI